MKKKKKKKKSKEEERKGAKDEVGTMGKEEGKESLGLWLINLSRFRKPLGWFISLHTSSGNVSLFEGGTCIVEDRAKVPSRIFQTGLSHTVIWRGTLLDASSRL